MPVDKGKIHIFWYKALKVVWKLDKCLLWEAQWVYTFSIKRAWVLSFRMMPCPISFPMIIALFYGFKMMYHLSLNSFGQVVQITKTFFLFIKGAIFIFIFKEKKCGYKLKVKSEYVSFFRKKSNWMGFLWDRYFKVFC